MRGQRQVPAVLYPRERPDTHCIGGWVGPRAGLDRCGKSRPIGIRSPDHPARSQSLYRLRYAAHKYKYTKNKLCTNLVLFTRLYRDARSTSSEIRHYVSEISSAFLFVLLEGHSGPLTAINVEVKMSTYTDNYKWQSHTPPNTAKHLGTTQDAKLRCKPYVKKTREELGLKYMGRRSCLSIHSKLMLYKQISKPMWTHGIQLWGCTKQSNTDIIQRFQNKVLKTSLMHLGISETPTTIGTFKWRWLRMKLESSLRRKASPSRQRRIDPAARRQWTSAKA